MEDTIAFGLVLGLIGIVGYALYIFRKSMKEREEMQRAELAKKQKEADKFWAKRLSTASLKDAASNTPPKKRMFVKREEPTPTQSVTYAPAPTQSVQSDDGFITGMVVGALLDNLTHKHHTEERSVGVTKSESSWGFDDSDSRRSASESFSSSDSSSSWSSSDSSSSDSGPSSDW